MNARRMFSERGLVFMVGLFLLIRMSSANAHSIEEQDRSDSSLSAFLSRAPELMPAKRMTFAEAVLLYGTNTEPDEVSREFLITRAEIEELQRKKNAAVDEEDGMLRMAQPLQPLSGGIWTINYGFSTGVPVRGDYNGDGFDDLALWNTAANYDWFIRDTITGNNIAWYLQHGMLNGKPVSGDYDGDGESDLAIFDAAGGAKWYIRSVSGTFSAWGIAWGWNGAVTVPGDFNGDGSDDIAVFDASAGRWYIRTVAGQTLLWNHLWGSGGMVPVPGDYDGDGADDLMVYSPSAGKWYGQKLNGTVIVWDLAWGGSAFVAVPGRFNGDNKSDFATYTAVNGQWRWYIRPQTGNAIYTNQALGQTSDRPAPGDYEGWGVDYIGVFRPSNGNWYILVDRDLDGLPDGFEWRYWNNLGQVASGDPDGDGAINSSEALYGTDPVNAASYPTTISGQISYQGYQVVGDFVVQAIDALSQTVSSVRVSGPAFQLEHVPTLETYTLFAFRDLNANDTLDCYEARTVQATPFVLSAPLSQMTVTLNDPAQSMVCDTDADGLPDGWEIEHFGNYWAQNASGDPDDDGHANVYEWVGDGNPMNGSSWPDHTVYIQPGGQTIQQAIDSTATDYAIIELGPGTYTGPGNRDITLRGKKIMLRGAEGEQAPVIDLQNVARGLAFTNGEGRLSVIHGLTFSHGAQTDGAGMYCITSSPTLFACRFEKGRSTDDGGGAYIAGGDPVFRKCGFSFNEAISGAAVCVVKWLHIVYPAPYDSFGAAPEFYECEFTANKAQRGAVATVDGTSISGGGETLRKPSAFTMVRCRMEKNVCTGEGANLRFLNKCSVILHNSLIRGNRGSAISTSTGPDLVLKHCTIVNNNSYGMGSAIHAASNESGGGQVLLKNSIVWDNLPASDQLYSATTYGSIQAASSDVDQTNPDESNHSTYQNCLQSPPVLDGQGRLKYGSPCIDSGDPAQAVSPDRDGELRDAAPDMGWDERRDADGDTLADYWETQWGLDPNVYDGPTDDYDNDGLTNFQEADHGSNPLDDDSDADGLTDGVEIALGTPLLVADSDGDGFLDGQEVADGTNPLNADTDGDGLNDADDPAPLQNGSASDVALHVTSEGAEQGVIKADGRQLVIPQGTKCVYYKATVFSSEYPEYTGQSSEFDDVVTWGITGPTEEQTKGPHSYNVNSLHSQFEAGPFAGGNVVVAEGVLDYSIPAASSASYLHLTGTAVNVSDGYLGSGVALQVAVLKVEIDKIVFNFDSTACTQDGLNIRQDYTTAISVPEYVKGGQNRPAAYVKEKAVKIKVRLTVDPPTITSIKIKGVSDDTDGSLGDAAEQSISFSGGVSYSGVADDPATTTINEAEFIEFTVNGNTPSTIHKSEDAWKWIVTEVNGAAVSDIQADRTSGHKIFTVLAAPTTAPWNQTAGDACNAWAKALELVCSSAWAGGQTTTSLAGTGIAQKLYTQAFYFGGTPHQRDGSGNLKLGILLDTECAAPVNCEDVADMFTALGNVLGCANVSVKLAADMDTNPVLPCPAAGMAWTNYASLSYHAISRGADGYFDSTYGFNDIYLPYNIAAALSLSDYLDLLIAPGATRPAVVSTWSPTIR